jgi:gamma-glutamyltranspeptidase/glutathione hydrolase
LDDTRWFPSGCVATPHHLASQVGAEVLAGGGTAIDAAVAANLVLAVVTPYHCGVGGDLLAMVWDDGPVGVVSVGAAPAGADVETVRAAVEAGHGGPGQPLPDRDGMPSRGALAVTVPGAVAGWFDLLGRWGRRSFAELAAPAIRLAEDGFPVSPHASVHVEAGRDLHHDQPGWEATFGSMRAGQRFRQPELAATLRQLAAEGPGPLYGGELGRRVVETLAAAGSSMTRDDLAAHRVTHVAPLCGHFRGVEVLELPPPTQGVTALTAMAVSDALGPAPDDPALAAHLAVEAVKLALADRQQHLGDRASMATDAEALLGRDRIRRLASRVDREHAAAWPPARPLPGGTAYLAAADRDGLQVGLIQSNYLGFGSGVVVPGTGVGLHDRGAAFSLDPGHPAAIGPGRRPPHTLIPALALRDGQPWLGFGTMGGDAQAQVHLQLLTSLLDHDAPLQAAVDAPRWVVDVADGVVAVEADLDAEVVAGLTARGHRLRRLGAKDHHAGHANAIVAAEGGWAAASDPRSEGAVAGH